MSKEVSDIKVLNTSRLLEHLPQIYRFILKGLYESTRIFLNILPSSNPLNIVILTPRFCFIEITLAQP